MTGRAGTSTVGVCAGFVGRAFRETALPSQATASLYTLAATALVAREVDSVTFGLFAVVQIMVIFAVGVQRAWFLVPVMVEPGSGSQPPVAGVRTRVGAASGLMVLVAAVVGGLAGGRVLDVCVALAVCGPPVLYWDAVRAHYQGARRYPVLVRGEVTCLVVGLVWFALATALSGDFLVIVAGLAVAPAAAAVTTVPPWSARWRPWDVPWPSRAGRNLVLDYLLYTGLDQVILVASGVFLTVVATGALRLGQTALGPITVLLLACEATAVPRLRDLPRSTPARTKLRRAAPVFVGTAGLALACGLALAVAPVEWGTAAFGPTWAAAGGVVAALAVRQAVSALAVIPTLALLTSSATRQIIRCRLLTAPLVAAGSLLALLSGDVATFAWSFAGLHLLASWALWWTALRLR